MPAPASGLSKTCIPPNTQVIQEAGWDHVFRCMWYIILPVDEPDQGYPEKWDRSRDNFEQKILKLLWVTILKQRNLLVASVPLEYTHGCEERLLWVMVKGPPAPKPRAPAWPHCACPPPSRLLLLGTLSHQLKGRETICLVRGIAPDLTHPFTEHRVKGKRVIRSINAHKLGGVKHVSE